MLRSALPKIKTEALPGPIATKMIAERLEIIPQGVRCQYPLVIEKGAGAMIEDPDGNRFLDWVGGVGVLNVGYSHPKVIEAVQAQSTKYFHAMVNIATHPEYLALGKRLAALAPTKYQDNKVFFTNSGAETIENAVKIAKSYTGRQNIIVFSGGFHGRTYLTMTMTSKKAYAAGQGALANGVFRAEFPYYYRSPVSADECLAYYQSKFEKIFEECAAATEIAAVVIEPLQGEGGFIPVPLEYVKVLRRLCDQNGILLIADEVQTGFARTGRLFATEYWAESGVKPDILACAKSIAAGLPLGAVIGNREILDSVPAGVVGGTYGGNAVACAAGLAVLEVIESERLVERAQEIGQKCMTVFQRLQNEYAEIGDVRGLGAMIGIEFVKDKQTKTPFPELVSQLVEGCAKTGLIIENAGIYGNVIRFLAPLVITDKQLEAGFEIFEKNLKELLVAL
ncbi:MULTISPECIES: aspartate aminotransferase family protein [unclassified Enterococcus]|uniref:aspartate aminotransferase family protein n=1 Tax=unclassified Enterococcus TaxID=2608891 RepID=UPI0015555141|nr:MULTISPECIES: aspartate aminotransferase family protein [unclassified Enterococcus]MBS7577331.1 aspartate aminotransferase family protein [Enterococcus sp. MMGLQ5-2]MBS7584576.1 aspartate aminotransferase family protein [Enterococcus sp. MMGLQ5-1]NPD12431.1 aspartate aminotransferase family protein [Enterococcus sp. MMGLQ5-1]NPD37165.1 aspartate aminotransferase family protein [Enterococcus sp. MMGLQ5-2]